MPGSTGGEEAPVVPIPAQKDGTNDSSCGWRTRSNTVEKSETHDVLKNSVLASNPSEE